MKLNGWTFLCVLAICLTAIVVTGMLT